MGLCRRPVWRRRSAAVHYFRYGFRHRALYSRRRQPAAGPRGVRLQPLAQRGVSRGDCPLFTSGSKSFNIPAFTGAYGFIPEENERDSYLQALKGRDGLSSPSVPALVAHIAAYRDGAPWLDALRDYLQANMRYVADTLNNAFPALCWQPPEATYLAWIDLRPLNVDDRALQQALIAEQKVAIMPGYTYGPEGNGFLRLNVGCPREKLERGVEGLIAALRSLS